MAQSQAVQQLRITVKELESAYSDACKETPENDLEFAHNYGYREGLSLALGIAHTALAQTGEIEKDHIEIVSGPSPEAIKAILDRNQGI